MHFVYIVRCADGTLYTGYARDPTMREEAHNSGRGAKYTAGRRPVQLVYSERFESAGDALKREHQIKRLNRAKKEELISMTPRLIALLAAVLVAGAGVLLAQAREPRPTCTMRDGHTYLLGTVVTDQERFYRCLSVFGPKMARAGAAWVEVEKSAARWITPRVAE